LPSTSTKCATAKRRRFDIQPEQFFARTFLTKNMLELAGQVVRRLNGVTTETSAVFRPSPPRFGGGKTHSLTLLYHLAKHGPASHGGQASARSSPSQGKSRCRAGEAAVFVGTEFDSLAGRGGDGGTPLRKTPWEEIAWQLGGATAFALVAEHDAKGVAPGGDVLAKVIPDTPSLILMDELMNYISRNRKSGLATQFYNFVHNLTERARGKTRAVLAVSIPASEMEMTAEDLEDYNRITKLLDRTGKALVMSAEAETSEIIRRRLFEWNLDAVSAEGKVLLDKDAKKTCEEYAQWCLDSKTLIPGWFSVDEARKAFEACYPFHPTVLSVFERKWRGIGKFQQTRGVLRLLALWVARPSRKATR
jgi:predicted AAA+ superfamily ATPase